MHPQKMRCVMAEALAGGTHQMPHGLTSAGRVANAARRPPREEQETDDGEGEED